MKGIKTTHYKGFGIVAMSQNKHHSSRNTKNPRQVWSAAVSGVDVAEGMGSMKDAIESAQRYIDRKAGKL